MAGESAVQRGMMRRGFRSHLCVAAFARIFASRLRCRCAPPEAAYAKCSLLTSCIPHPASRILHSASRILHPASCILHPASRILHPASCIPHPASRIPHPASRIPHPASRIPHPAFHHKKNFNFFCILQNLPIFAHCST